MAANTQSIATYQALMDLAKKLEDNRERIGTIENDLKDRLDQLLATTWQDNVAFNFRNRYEQAIIDINKTLISALDSYIQHLRTSASIIQNYDPS